MYLRGSSVGIERCLERMGFDKREAGLLLDETRGEDARAVIREHIAALEAERDGITRQISETSGVKPDAKIQSPEVENPAMTIPDADGNLVNAAAAVERAKADIDSAKELGKAMGVAAECALRFGA